MAELQRKELEARFNRIYEDRKTWEPVWKDIKAYILPRRGRFDNLKPNRGKRMDETIVDSAPLYSIRTLAAGLMSGLTSPARPWFRLVVPDLDVMEDPDAKWWLDKAQKIMLHWFSKIKFYDAAYTIYEEIAGFGTGCMGLFEVDDPEKVARCQSFTIGTYAFAVGPTGEIDTFCRKIWYTAKQMVEYFGKENVSQDVLDAFNRQGTEDWFMVHHMVEPNDTRIPGKFGAKNMAWRSVYWDPSTPTNSKFLKVSGFDSFPFFGPRWEVQDSSDAYGTSPGWDALGDSKMLQTIAFDGLVGLEKEINPPMLAPASMRQSGVSLIPGGLTFYGDSRVVNNDMVKPLLQVKPNLEALRVWVQDLEAKIQKAFYADLFLMFTDTDRREITATEVLERHQEKLLALGPLLDHLESEFLAPFIARSFILFFNRGLFPEMPKSLHGMEVKVEFESVLAQAQKSTGIEPIRTLVAFAGEMSATYPTATAKIDIHEAIDQLGDMMGVAPGVIRSDEDVQKMVDAQEQAAQQQAATEQMQQSADALQKMSNAKMGTPEGGTSVLDGIDSTMNGALSGQMPFGAPAVPQQ